MQKDEEIGVLWLRPDTGENVSTRRARIAEHLENRSVSVTFRNMRLSSPISGLSSVLLDEYDVVIANVRFPMYSSYPFAELRKKPFIADIGDPLSQLSHYPTVVYSLLCQYEWWIIKRADMAMFAHEESFETAQEKGLNGILVKNAVNYSMFAYPDSQTIEYTENELTTAGVDLDRPIALFPGRFSAVYHINETLNAAENAQDWQFVFIGERGQQDLIEQAAQTKENVFYLGSFQHEDIPGFVHHADVGLCLVDNERPLKLLEFGAAQLPVLASPGALQKEFSDDQLWFVQPTSEKIADGLKTILDNPVESERRSRNLQQVALENNWQSVADKYYEVIRDL